MILKNFNYFYNIQLYKLIKKYFKKPHSRHDKRGKWLYFFPFYLSRKSNLNFKIIAILIISWKDNVILIRWVSFSRKKYFEIDLIKMIEILKIYIFVFRHLL